MTALRFPLYLALGLLTQCSSCKDPAPEPLPTLPPETQTGARTFGCLVNGKPFVAKGINQITAEQQGINSLALRTSTEQNNYIQSFNILLNGNLISPSQFLLVPFNKPLDFFRNEFVADYSSPQCNYQGTNIRRGTLTLTHYDPVARIIAGRFAFTLFEPGCDSLRVTNGRFDVRF